MKTRFFTSIAILLTGISSVAQEKKPFDSTELKEVIIIGRQSPNAQAVSAGKIDIPVLDLPQSISILDKSIIANQQAQRLSDVMKNVNGVYLGTTRGNVQESFYARGYNLGSGNLFKNGARVNIGAMPELNSLEKVEILKGSAAILFGNVAPGGIVNMITKQPQFKFGGEVSMRAGSYDLYKPTFDVYGPISQKIAYRVNGAFESAGSFRDQVSSDRYYINPSMLFKLSAKTELLVQGDYLQSSFTPDFGIGSLDNTKIPNLPRNSYFGTPWQYNKVKQGTGSVNVKHILNDKWTIIGNAAYQSFDRNYYSTERIQAAANGDWTRPLNKIQSHENYYSAQFDLNGKFNTGTIGHILLAGVDADRYHTTNYTFNNPTTYDKINILDPQKYAARTDIPVADKKVTQAITPINRFGAYIQDLISFSPKIKLLAGIRWSYQNAEAAQTTYLLKDSVVRGDSKADQAFSPRVGLVYKPMKNMSVFASYASSFTPNTGRDIYNNAVKPSIIDQYELGVKKDFLNGLISVNVTGYRIINNNLAQTAQFKADGSVNNDTNIKELAGQTTSDGIETDITAHIACFDITAGHSYNNMRYTKTPESKGSFIEGERLVNTPSHTANASLFYTFSKNKLKGLKLGATVVHIGERFGGWNNTQQQTQTYSRLIPVEGFTTLDLSAGYSFRRVSVLAKVSNVTNTYNYYVHENYSINPIPPTQLIATVAYKF
jgi:iron complex outermembrane recepter protein